MIALDDADRRILRIIQQHPELTLREISEQAGISHTPCWRRMQRMQEEGVISEKRHLVDPQALGFELTLFCFIKIKEHRKERLLAFEQAVLNVPEVVQCYSATGNYDYIMRVLAKSVADYDDTVKNRIVELPNVDSVVTSLILKEVKNDVAIPV